MALKVERSMVVTMSRVKWPLSSNNGADDDAGHESNRCLNADTAQALSLVAARVKPRLNGSVLAAGYVATAGCDLNTFCWYSEITLLTMWTFALFFSETSASCGKLLYIVFVENYGRLD